MTNELKPFNPQSIDARDWAREFMRLYENSQRAPQNVPIWLNESLMLGWFANAIMAGMDEQARRTSS